MDIIWSVLGFIVVMAVIVTIHEWGHYQVARWFDVKILRFSIGFGKALYRRQMGETEFVIAQIPLGGYVKFADEREAPVAEKDVHRAFNRQSVYKRFAIVLAGPLVNLIFAWWVFACIYLIGVTGFKPIIETPHAGSALEQAMKDAQPKSQQQAMWLITEVDNASVVSWNDVRQKLMQSLAVGKPVISMGLQSLDSGERLSLPAISLADLDIDKRQKSWLESLGISIYRPPIGAIIGQLQSGGPAEKAGLKVADKILRIGENNVSSWQDFVKVVQAHPDSRLELVYQRERAVYQTWIELASQRLPSGEQKGLAGIGVLLDSQQLKAYQVTQQYGLMESFEKGYQRAENLLVMSLVMLKRMLIGDISSDNLSGPISIAQFSGQALENGLISFLGLLGLLSLSIGILNLLPVPMLDGGHLVYYVIEMLKGSPVSDRVMMVGQFVGLILIAGLTMLALFNDLIRITHG